MYLCIPCNVGYDLFNKMSAPRERDSGTASVIMFVCEYLSVFLCRLAQLAFPMSAY